MTGWSTHEPAPSNRLTWLLLATFLGVCVWGVWHNLAHASTGNPGGIRQGTASWYSWADACRVNPDPACPTASGKSLYDLVNQDRRYAAMWKVPFGTVLRVCRANDPSRCSQVEIWDRGPARRLHRLIDLNPKSFQAVCGFLQQGVCQVMVEAVK